MATYILNESRADTSSLPNREDLTLVSLVEVLSCSLVGPWVGLVGKLTRGSGKRAVAVSMSARCTTGYLQDILNSSVLTADLQHSAKRSKLLDTARLASAVYTLWRTRHLPHLSTLILMRTIQSLMGRHPSLQFGLNPLLSHLRIARMETQAQHCQETAARSLRSDRIVVAQAKQFACGDESRRRLQGIEHSLDGYH